MGMETHSTKRNRVYKRKFDHEEAQRLWAEGGWTYRGLARHFGVSAEAVKRVVNETYRQQLDERAAAYLMGGTCVDCGKGCARYPTRSRDGKSRCRRCSTLKWQATNIRPGEQRCVTCREWKPNWDFPVSRSRINGRHNQCTPCQTKERRRWVEANRRVCEVCGERKVRPERGRTEHALCLDCYLELKKGQPAGATVDELLAANYAEQDAA